ncbi:unnamed protein product [Phytophthora fragariaefolia]|uniref:Unnamed protein product n=1 Tax=Phytophthora fragariaefolia TaxID=1490495 RepID=A0A9W6X8L0_9STRA|nr:unnamed protein product [Phytophthora fragariaefolia]
MDPKKSETSSFQHPENEANLAASLAHPDFSKPFHVNVDASDFAIGGYLFQLDENKAEKVIAYGGRKLSKPEMVYPIREKELLAALHAMRTWKVYLLDRPFYLNTDQHTLETILQQQTCSQRLARWLNELALFQPLFNWVPGPSNVIADAISRRQDWNDGTSRSISLSELLHALSDPKSPDADEQLLQMTTLTIDIKEACRTGTAFKPSTDGQSEMTIKFVGEFLRHFVGPHHDNWDELLFLAEFAYNSRTHSFIGMAPFMADLGYQPRTVAGCLVNSSRTTRASTFVTHQQAIIAETQDAMSAAQFQWHATYDRNRPHLVFKSGEEVLLDFISISRIWERMENVSLPLDLLVPTGLSKSLGRTLTHWNYLRVFDFILTTTYRNFDPIFATKIHIA